MIHALVIGATEHTASHPATEVIGALVAAAIISGGALVALGISQLSRGRRRLLTQRWSIYIGLPALTATLVLLPLQLQLSISDALALAGLALSLIFGMGARALERITSRLRIGIVIPSRVPFHNELRKGLKEAFESVRVDEYDDYMAQSHARERLAEFVPALDRTLAKRPDYLVVCSPSVELISSDEVIVQLSSFTRRGGGVVIIDNEPTDEGLAKLHGRWGSVTSDVREGAILIARYIANHINSDEDVLVIAGPTGSRPAEIRRDVLKDEISAARITVANSEGWTADAGYEATKEAFTKGQHPRYIVCGNDVMAIGAARALCDPPLNAASETSVFGYDGIPQALFAVDEPLNPICGTVETPPSLYGQTIGRMILDDARPFSSLRLRRIKLPGGQLVTKTTVKSVLES
jgi:ribose transport system substrate-binding protein